MHRHIKIGAAALIGLALIAGCGEKPAVDRQKAEKSIEAIKADPHMSQHQKDVTIAEIEKQLH